ncbi:MAG: hypothetical protein ACYDAG_07480, partial [Chloroflexota bacterium]
MVVVFNNLEDQYDHLSRVNDEAFLAKIRRRGERALLWLGHDKLVFLSDKPPHLDYLHELGYAGTTCIVPSNSSWSICRDILAEPPLLERIVEYAAGGRTIQLVPYVTTTAVLELALALERDYGLVVLLPESPDAAHLWLRDYADRKVGFRLLASSIFGPGALPEGYACQNVPEATAVARWFTDAGRRCIAKADRGNSGYGHMVLDPGGPVDIAGNPFLRPGLIVVEELVDSELFPSVELFVPPRGAGVVSLTYVSSQIIHGNHFAGITITPEQRLAGWYNDLVGRGLDIAGHLQEMGYVGYLDLDAAVDGAGRTLLLEVNPRRTGGTHAHEFALSELGPAYGEHAAIICHSALGCPRFDAFSGLLGALDPVLYPIEGQRRGVIITNTPTAGDRSFGCIIAGQGTADAT